jgi:hypothetical protein
MSLRVTGWEAGRTGAGTLALDPSQKRRTQLAVEGAVLISLEPSQRIDNAILAALPGVPDAKD